MTPNLVRLKKKANGRHGGVGWETMIIQGDMSKLPLQSPKYLAIVRAEQFNEGIPTYLKTKYAIHWKENSNHDQLKQELLKELFEIDTAPPLGEPPIFI